jgi:hypothetical protein
VSTAHHLYPVLLVDESFVRGEPFDKGNWSPFELGLVQSLQLIQEAVENDEYEKLAPDDCIKAYAKDVVYDRANVVVVLDPPENCHDFKSFTIGDGLGPQYCEHPMNGSIYVTLLYSSSFTAGALMTDVKDYFAWICSLKYDEAFRSRLPKCSDGAWKNQMSPATWTIGTARVKYCLSQQPKAQCQLKVALNLIYVVVCFNDLKFVIIVILATSNLVNREPLATIGDAVASFIDSQEQSTMGMCLLSCAEVHCSQKLDEYQEIPAVVYKPQNSRYSVSVSLCRWLLASILYVCFHLTLRSRLINLIVYSWL